MQQQELIMKLGMFEQQIKQIQQQLQVVEQNTIELLSIKEGLEDFKESKDKEVLAQIGRGIFLKAKIISEDLIVDIGNKKFVNKDIDSTKEMIQRQIVKVDEVKGELEKALEEINKQLTETMMSAQSQASVPEQTESSNNPDKKNSKDKK